MEQLHTECGLYAIYEDNNDPTVISKTMYGLSKLQHRGQESAGIGYFYEDRPVIYKELGLVKNMIGLVNKNRAVKGTISHVRYSTSGPQLNNRQRLEEAHPLMGMHPTLGYFMIAHNGNIPNLKKYKKRYQELNNDKVSSDTIFLKEFIQKVCQHVERWKEIFVRLLKEIPGVYCLTVLTNDSLWAVRDRTGNRPLSIGTHRGYCITSETCGLGDYAFLRDIRPGEIVCINSNGLKQYCITVEELSENMIEYEENIDSDEVIIRHSPTEKFCLFECIYFMNEESLYHQKTIHDIRFNFGRALARYDIDYFFNAKDTIVVGCPNTGIAPGKGYANEAKLPYRQIIIKNKHINRTFILPDDSQRIETLKRKFSFDKELIKNKHIVFVDDSIVRGNTIRCISKIFKDFGCLSFNVRVASPPVRYPCYFGIDIPTSEELVAYDKEIDEITKTLGLDTLIYLELSDMYDSLKGIRDDFCSSCFDGEYNKELVDW